MGMNVNWDLPKSKIESVSYSFQPGKIVEYGHKRDGRVIKTSVFIDKNKNGKLDASDQLFSVEYSDGSSTPVKNKYIDNNLDGYYDEMIVDDYTFGKSVKDEKMLIEEDKQGMYGKERRNMDYVYRDKYADGPMLLN